MASRFDNKLLVRPPPRPGLLIPGSDRKERSKSRLCERKEFRTTLPLDCLFFHVSLTASCTDTSVCRHVLSLSVRGCLSVCCVCVVMRGMRWSNPLSLRLNFPAS